MSTRPRPLTTWCRLLRLPNLFTVPGDAIAGYALASVPLVPWERLVWLWVVPCVLLLYAAGLLLNDFFDREADARERPERPIPSGAVRPGTVLLAGLVALAAGVVLGFVNGPAPGLATLVVATLVFGYDAGLKRVRAVGPLVMGSCRAGSVLIGACFGTAGAEAIVNTARRLVGLRAGFFKEGQDLLLMLAAAGAWALTSAVTVTAAAETGGRRPGRVAYLPGLTWAALAGTVWQQHVLIARWPEIACLVAMGLASVLGLGWAWAARAGRLATHSLIGRLIRAMIPVQAAWCLLTLHHHYQRVEGVAIILGFAALWAGATLSARRFYGS